MPPKVKVQKKEIVTGAVELVRKEGASALNARSLAKALNCSTQPIFSNFATMEELREAVMGEADELCASYVAREMEENRYPSYMASGMAYIRFAKEEKELFKLLHLQGQNEDGVGPLTDSDFFTEGAEYAGEKLLHLELWAYVHGIAAMFATSYLDLSWDLVSKMLSDSYANLKKQWDDKKA